LYYLLKIYHVGLQCRYIQVMNIFFSIVNLILSLLILSLTSHIFIKCNIKDYSTLNFKYKKNPTWLFLFLIIFARKKSFKIKFKVLSFFNTKLNAQSFTWEVMHKCLQKKNENSNLNPPSTTPPPPPVFKKKNLAITQLWCWMTLNTIGYPNHNEREKTEIILKYETK